MTNETTAKESRFTLATADEIRAIHERAIAFIDVIIERANHRYERSLDEEGYDRRSLRQQLRRALEALRFCSIAAGQLGDRSLFPLILSALKVAEKIEMDVHDDQVVMAIALKRLLRVGVPIDKRVKKLAAHRRPHVRQAVALGLLPRSAPEIALLEGLAKDPIPEVRAAAKKALSSVQEVPWWQGKLRRDPLSVLSADEALKLKPVLEGISQMLDEPLYHVAKREDELRALVQTLPDEIAVDLIETMHSANDPLATRLVSLLTLMLDRQGGLDAWKRLLVVWAKDPNSSMQEKKLLEPVMALPHDVRLSVCKELAAYAAGFPDDKKSRDYRSPAHFAAMIAGGAWPPGEDVTPILELLLAAPPWSMEKGVMDWVSGGLKDVFKGDNVNLGSNLERVIEARVAGFPGSWSNIGGSLNRALERAPVEMIRVAAERAILSDVPHTIQWGLERLLGGAFDPERDGPREALVRRFFAEPTYRELLCGSTSLNEIVLPLRREQLRAGLLELKDAAHVVAGISKLHGGEAGDVADEDRQALREARLRWIANGFQPYSAADVGLAFPEGPWTSEEREILDGALRALREGGFEADDLVIPIATALTKKPLPETMAIFDEVLFPNFTPEYRPLLKRLRKKALQALSLSPLTTDGAITGASSGKVDWMDESDEDEDDDDEG